MAVARQGVVAVEIAEAPAELDVLAARDVLISGEENPVVEKRAVDLAEKSFAHVRDVDAAHLGAERVRELMQLESRGFLRRPSSFPRSPPR